MKNVRISEELIETVVDWDQVKDGNGQGSRRHSESVRHAFSNRPPRLLDPFMGSGETGLEALRLGCETYGVDINPVAHLIDSVHSFTLSSTGDPKPPRAPTRSAKGKVTVTRFPRISLRGDVGAGTGTTTGRPSICQSGGRSSPSSAIYGRVWDCPTPDCGAEIPLVVMGGLQTAVAAKSRFNRRLTRFAATRSRSSTYQQHLERASIHPR